MAILLTLLFFAASCFLLLRFNGGKRKEVNLPPSPPELPIIGNLHQLGTLPHYTLRAISEKYGPLMLLRLGNVPTLVVSSVEMAQEVLKIHDITFSGRPPTKAAKQLLYNCNNITFSPYSEYWRQAKKICVLELLSAKRVSSFQWIREEEVAQMMEKISQSCSRMETINLTELLLSLTSGIIARTTIGRKYEGEQRRKEFASNANELMVLLGTFCVGDYIPSLAWIDVLTGFNARLKRTARDWKAFLDRVVNDHLNGAVDGTDTGEQRDFVDLLLNSQRDSTLGFHLTDDNIKGIILDMIVAGTDTTQGTMVWAMTELMRHHSAMEKAQTEVRRVVGRKQKVEVEDLHQMNYLKFIIKETLRLHPLAPLLAPHESTTDVTIQGYHIPKKTRVLVNVWALARDPKLWENAEKFLPERFENNRVDFKGKDLQFIPFGAGRRMCPGMSFSSMTMELGLANLLYWFDWKLPSDMSIENMDMSELPGITIHKKTPLHLIPVHHFSTNN